MSTPLPSPDVATGWRYRFDGVEIDLVARRLRIDGEERPCSQRALQLLELLCAQPGVLLARNQLIDALWPGGQVVSDEALTQIIFRTRAVLGPYADRLATVRGAGLRLDAQVRREAVRAPPREAGNTAGPSADAVTPARVPPDANVRPDAVTPPRAERRKAVAPAVPPKHPRIRLTLLLALLLLAASIAAGTWQWRSGSNALDAPIDVGYGLDAVDAQASNPQTLVLLRDAFRQDALGDRERARALFEAIHSSDTETPIPALFLALYNIGSDDMAAADAWLVQARARVAPLQNPNLSALLAYIEAERVHDARAVVRHAGAVLDQRPRAWQMHTARAHLLLAMHLPEAALDELQAIDVPALDHRKLAMAVADRAALGDVAGAQRVLERLGDTLDAPERAFLRGRIAWSRGDLTAAHTAFVAAVDEGRKRARFALLHRAMIHVGVLELLLHQQREAIVSLDAAYDSALQSHATGDRIDIALLLAQLHHDAGDTARARERLGAALEALHDNPDAADAAYVALFVARLAPDLLPAGLGRDEPLGAALLDARQAVIGGDSNAANTALDAALARGALDTALADETRLLQAELGRLPAAEIALDPPFPPLSRYATRHVLAELDPPSRAPGD